MHGSIADSCSNPERARRERSQPCINREESGDIMNMDAAAAVHGISVLPCMKKSHGLSPVEAYI